MEITNIQDSGNPVTPTTAEDVFADVFGNIQSSTGEEGLLKLASKYALQIDGRQMRTLMMLKAFLANPKTNDEIRLRGQNLIREWLELKQYNRSMTFVMTALDSISLRKLITENTMKINVQK